MTRFFPRLLLLLVFLAGCKPKAPAPAGADSDAKSYPARGVVRGIAADGRSITIQHEAIPGYMAAMTMNFPVKNTNELAGLAPADGITFDLVVRPEDDWVEHLRRTGQQSPPPVTANVAQVTQLEPGDLLPDAELTTETGARLHLADFRGCALVFTFFFTSCPLPDYCPRMNKNFAEARQLILAATNVPANWQFLSVSFDPGFDTPEILTSYATLYRGADTNRWLFAVASTNALAVLAGPLDLMITHQGGSISHNLRTVVLDPRGRIYRQFDGNKWTPRELADAVLAAARR